MKKTLTLLLTLMLAAAIRAQEHMTFMDVTLGQSVDSFATAMLDKGFQPFKTTKLIPHGQRIMTGKFNGSDVRLTIFYGVHTMQVTSVALRFPEIKELGEFLAFYEAMKRIITEQYCTEGDVINEQPDMNTLPSYGMKMDYGKVMIDVDPNVAFRLTVTYTDQHNTIEERKRRYD